MKKKNGFAKPSVIEKELEKTFSVVISAIPPTPQKTKEITSKIKHIGKKIEEKRKKNIRRVIKK